MDKAFFTGNRRALYESLDEGELLLLFAGKAPRQSSDQYYPYYANRNFVYLTGLDKASAGFVLLARRQGGAVSERLYILPPDAHAERWNGRRVQPDEACERSGIRDIAFLESYEGDLHRLLSSGAAGKVWLDLFRHTPSEQDGPAHLEEKRIRAAYPGVAVGDIHRALRALRTIKQPCEIEAMRKAAVVTREGIVAMMKASRPGMFEYEYKAEFDRALTRRGVLEPGFPSIIAAGRNNFCIHYYDYTGQAQDGDMILNDVGAQWEGLTNDVSRGWPCNGRFSERQRLVYNCAYETSQHMFSIIRPGMRMEDVDKTVHAFCAQKLVEIGLLDRVENERRYMWHGGAHHVGWDVHDEVEPGELIRPGMVFCVDVGIYVEEWGIGFRLEDNCLVTEDGCENLTRGIPRTIEEIEETMRR